MTIDKRYRPAGQLREKRLSLRLWGDAFRAADHGYGRGYDSEPRAGLRDLQPALKERQQLEAMGLEPIVVAEVAYWIATMCML